MKLKQREQLKSMSVPELSSELEKKRSELFRLRLGRSETVKNPLKERMLRREIAAILTCARLKEAKNAIR